MNDTQCGDRSIRGRKYDHQPRPSLAAGFFMVVACAVVAAGGCSSRTADKWIRARPETHPAGGTVLVDGRGVAGVKVQFEHQADDGRLRVAFGYTDSAGRFRLRTFHDGDGAVAGTHAVLIERVTFEPLPKPAGAEMQPTREVSHLPERYRAANTSGLTATVEAGGRNMFSFSITSK